jgi:PAB-dependent poly(A)-specific ribonuclease subunit 2
LFSFVKFKKRDEEFSELWTFTPHDSLNRSKIAIAGNDLNLFSMDIVKEKIINQIEMKEGTSILKSGKYLACGGMRGNLNLCDPKTLKVEHSYSCHHGTISDIDIKDNLLVTCGLVYRNGGYVVDQNIKAFDLRTNSLLGQIHFVAGPGFLKFHPLFSNLLCIVSQDGRFL